MQGLPDGKITTSGVSGQKTIDDVPVFFAPAALYCYEVGINLLEGKITG
jgi:hypothetical protein